MLLINLRIIKAFFKKLKSEKNVHISTGNFQSLDKSFSVFIIEIL